MSWKSYACTALAVCLVFGAAGCGSQTFTGGFGTLTITSVAPPVCPGMIPTAVVITGGDFSNQVGTIVTVEWIASTGTPFLGGTSSTATTLGTITSATTIATTTPRVVICGPATITASIKVTMPSGVFGMSTTAIKTFAAPTVTNFTGGGIFPAAIPTPFVLNGTGFGDIGSPVTIHWSSPAPLFDAGSSMTTTTSGVVASPTRITGSSPLALVCGPLSLPAIVSRVSFQDGSCTPTAGPFPPATFVAPTVTTAVNTGGGTDDATSGFAAAIPEPFSLTGTGFGPVGGTATVNVTAAANPIFVDGTSTTTAVQGTIISATRIDVPESAWALMCNNPPGITAETVRFDVVLPDGSCTPPVLLPGAAGTYFAPTITSILNQDPAGGFVGTNDFSASRPVDFVLSGFRFGSPGDLVQVTFTVLGGPTPFENGTSATATVNANVVNSTTITGVSPLALVCGVASLAANVNIVSPGGSCAPVPTTADFFAPTIAAIMNTSAAGAPYSGSTAPANFAGAISEPFTITGTGFGPVGGTAYVTWQNDATDMPTPYLAGTSNTITVPAEITSPTTLTGMSPVGAFCSPLLPGGAGGSLLATMPDGACTLSSGFAVIMHPPTITAIANLDRGGGIFLAALPETFQVTGTDFGPVGGTATVRLTSTAVGVTVPGTPFAGGTAGFVDVLATITSRTTIEGTSPEALLCPIAGTDAATGVNADIDTTVTLEGGSCTPVISPLVSPALIQGPTLTGSTLLIPNPPMPGMAGISALDVPTTVVLGQDEMPDFRITGTGFAPLGAIVMVQFDDLGNGTGLLDLNGGSTLMVPAFVVSDTVIEGQLPVVDMPRLLTSEIVRTTVTLAPNGSCAYDDVLFNLVAPPTITTVVNQEANTGNGLLFGGIAAADIYAGISSPIGITGTGFVGAGAVPPATDVIVYSSVDGLDPNTDVPVRRLGSGNPVAGLFGHSDLWSPFGGYSGDSNNISNLAVRMEKLAPDLDVDGDGLVPYTLRAVNADGQYHDFAAGNYRVQSATANPTGMGSARIRNNNSIAVNPVSFTTDFGDVQYFWTDPTDASTPGANILAVSNDEVLGGGFGLSFFNGTDILLMRSLDAGVTWTTAPLGAAGIDMLPPMASRSYAQVAYDAFGNALLAYVVDDWTAIDPLASVVLLRSQDNGLNWTPDVIFTLPDFGPPFDFQGSAGLANSLDLAVGPNGVGGQRAVLSFVDGSGFWGAAHDVVTVLQQDYAALNTPAGPFSVAPASDTVTPPSSFTIPACECAVGNSGEVYVGWQEPAFVFVPPFTTDFYFNVDADGLAGFAWFFGTDILAFSDFVPSVTLAAFADVAFFEPSMDLCVARAGTNAGRLLWVYDHIDPNAFAVDHAQVIARISDVNGLTWSAGVATHPIDIADRFLPAVCSDRVTGRFYLSWYDTTSSAGAPALPPFPPLGTPAATFERYASASTDGVTWGTVRALSGARGPSAHVVDFDTDFGAFAGIDAYNGCVYATWGDTADSGLNADPVVVGYQQK